MNRRKALQLTALAGGAMMLPRMSFAHLKPTDAPSEEIRALFDTLQSEPPARCEVRSLRGAPRVFLNGDEIYPLLIWTHELERYTPAYKQMGFNYLHPWISLSAFWPAPGTYDFSGFDAYMARLLRANPDAYFLFRVFLYAPRWWKERHPKELVRFGLQPPASTYEPVFGEGGYEVLAWNDLQQPSYASQIWKDDTSALFRAFIRHVEASPLRSRVLGYHHANGISHEWHYFHSMYLPDESERMREALGSIPEAARRVASTHGLFRDPAKERDVIEYYRGFHELEADTVIHFSRLVKEETKGRVLSGAFFLYLLENIWIQEAGHLAPEKILRSKEIDFIATPYTYLRGNIETLTNWDTDLLDDAGRWLGRARGVGGDGGFRVMLESLHRHGKLFVTEMDPCTFVETKDALRGNGGTGSETPEGSVRIVERDMGRMFVSGAAGWFLDFGTWTPMGTGGTPWYTPKPIADTIKRRYALSTRRLSLDNTSVAEIAAVYDAKSFFVTQHWKQMEPSTRGQRFTDFINYWFLDAQARPIHRMGAPADFLYRFDLTPADMRRYKLFLMPNLFYLTAEEAEQLRSLFKGSGATVVWYYAPGYVRPEALDLEQMQRLTGFTFQPLMDLGPMLIRPSIEEKDELITRPFGVNKNVFPRFAVQEKSVRSLGSWVDGKGTALAMQEVDGYTSVYTGAAPLPVEILRWLAKRAGVTLWSDRPDVVVASRDAAMLVATERGKRTLRLPVPLALDGKGEAVATHELTLDMGEVRVFWKT